MNAERLKKLTERAAQATKVAAEIQTLRGAIGAKYERCSFQNAGLEGDLLRQAVELGRLKLIEQNEALLECLIATEPETPAAVPVEMADCCECGEEYPQSADEFLCEKCRIEIESRKEGFKLSPAKC